MTLSLPSPIEEIVFENKRYLLKRDDLIHHDFSGNKARKLHYFLDHDFPDIRNIISYGSAQSNAMYSLSVLAKIKGWEFTYFVDHISRYLKENPHGNYGYALQNGMDIREERLPAAIASDTLLIEEGGRQIEAAWGVARLADEILHDCCEEVALFLPSGTGTTALFLQKYLPFKVYTTACVGDAEYLKKQFFMLEPDEKYHPEILNCRKKYHFAKLYDDFFKIWIELKKQTGIVFDLLYDPKGWLCLLENEHVFQHRVLYIHQGGLIGNESMIKRYERKIIEKNK